MNALIRGVKGTLVVVALVAVGLALRWMTDGALSGVRSYDLESLTVLAIGTVAWIAYGWFVLAIVLTVLEQIPGAIGALAGLVAGRITSTTARTLLRSSLGVAAVTPLTVGVAHATPGTGTNAHASIQLEPRSTVQLTNTTDTTTWRTTEPPSTIRLGSRASGTPTSTGTPKSAEWRSTEPPSTVRLGKQARLAQSQSQTDTAKSGTTTPSPERPTAASSNHSRTTASTDPKGSASDHPKASASTHPKSGAGNRSKASTSTISAGGVPASDEQGRRRVGVPDRPTAGAPTRYTDLRSGVPVRVAARVVVRPGDSLWSIAAQELGADASAEAVAARWPQWYAANRDVIGPDPDLILPGQVLRTPAAATGDHVPPTSQEQ